MTDTLEALERRVRELEDAHTITLAFTRYNRAVDYGGDLRPLFSEDLLVDVVTPAGESLNRQEGAENYIAYRVSVPVAPERYEKHLALSPLVQVDGDEAEVENYFIVLRAVEGAPRIASFGRAFTKLQRSGDDWVITSRRAEVESVA
jgi:hypothetical protein